MIQKILFKLQRKIQKEKNMRRRRNLQRLLFRNRSLQFLILCDFIQYKCETKFDFLIWMQPKKRQSLLQNIRTQLWILVLEPCIDFHIQHQTPNISHTLKKLGVQHIFLLQFSNDLNQIAKYWILSNILIDKKFFFYWVKVKNSLPLKKLFLRFRIFDWKTHFSTLFKVPLLEFNNFYIQPIGIPTEIKTLDFQKSAHKKGLRIKFIKLISLEHGVSFLGWFFQNTYSGSEHSISRTNFDSFKEEIKKFLQKTSYQPLDKIIYNLKKKIWKWQHFYFFESQRTEFNDSLIQFNEFLLWQLWRCLRMRHKNKSFQWLYIRYWKDSTSQKWVFNVNTEKLFIKKR
uniref:Group II intron maturase-specific domain-containing protein n=1 Tax=Pseudocodium devriesii TaxID=453070 RepID=A0A386B0Z2_9CHLO|nr:hypothetical protein [Pseudocodium devriesii]AYC65368.1 hypothetical protein [Pseudocodium devriesii]